jgi:Signal transduction histidine kinase
MVKQAMSMRSLEICWTMPRSGVISRYRSVWFGLKKEKSAKFSLLLQIEDDGPGIPEAKLVEILQRGVRADEHMQGHGIGMAVVSELTALLGGQLSASTSETLGGMKWQVYLP